MPDVTIAELEAAGRTDELTGNEQNPGAVGFYEHMGFRTYARSERDEQGGPYTILHMRLEGTSG